MCKVSFTWYKYNSYHQKYSHRLKMILKCEKKTFPWVDSNPWHPYKSGGEESQQSWPTCQLMKCAPCLVLNPRRSATICDRAGTFSATDSWRVEACNWTWSLIFIFTFIINWKITLFYSYFWHTQFLADISIQIKRWILWFF